MYVRYWILIISNVRTVITDYKYSHEITYFACCCFLYKKVMICFGTNLT